MAGCPCCVFGCDSCNSFATFHQEASIDLELGRKGHMNFEIEAQGVPLSNAILNMSEKEKHHGAGLHVRVLCPGCFSVKASELRLELDMGAFMWMSIVPIVP